jgi:prevent-host-death family protein
MTILYNEVVMTPSLSTSPRARRLGVAEAKSKLSDVLRQAPNGPTIIHSRGKDLAVVLAIEDYERLMAGQRTGEAGGAALLRQIEALKQRHGGGVDDFEPARLDLVPAQPFARRKKRA